MKRNVPLLAAYFLVLVTLCTGLWSGKAAAEDPDRVYLTVSKIDLTLVGDTENIYVGTAPVEKITWTSENPEIVSVENGVLTAAGVGTTTIHADYGEQHWQCTAGCLAEDTAALELLSRETLAAPKRLPAKTDYDPAPFYSEVALLGDSITYIFYQNEMRSNQLGHPLFLCRGGVSINGFLLHLKELSYQGVEMYVQDIVEFYGVKKLFIMLGQNDLGYLEVQETLKNYAELLKRIRQKSPDIEIYIQTCAPEYAELSPTNPRNRKIYEFNALLPEFAKEQNAYLVDVAPYLESHRQRLAPIYSLDQEIHVNEPGCLIWGQVLSNFAELKEIKGE